MLLDMKKRLYKRSLAKHTERDVSKRVSTQILSIRLSLRFFFISLQFEYFTRQTGRNTTLVRSRNEVNKNSMMIESGIQVINKTKQNKTKQKTPWLLVRKRIISTERPLLVGEVSANFCG
jgi:hypothetical protein